MRVRWEPNGVEVEATATDLAEMAREIKALATGRGSGPVERSTDTSGSPAPYVRFLRNLRVDLSTGPVLVSEAPPGTLSVVGESGSLERLASFFDFALDEAKGAHHHYEYFDGNPYIAKGSVPLVISARTDG